MLFEIFQPHPLPGFDTVIEHVVLNDIDDVLVPGISCFTIIILFGRTLVFDCSRSNWIVWATILDSCF